MSTSSKTPASLRQGGPGSSEQNAKRPAEIRKPPPDGDRGAKSRVSGGGGERDVHHARDEKRKGGG
jgi:hypothetical protein